MKLYHGTKAEYEDSVNQFGLTATSSCKPSKEDHERGVVTEDNVVYGFDNIEDAISFAYDNFDHIIICSFEVSDEEVKEDKEYEDGNAYTVNHDISSEKLDILDEDKLTEMQYI